MKIDHLGIWVADIEVMKIFYLTYFEVTCGDKYYNPGKKFTSCFLAFPEGGSRIELMHRPDIPAFIGMKGLINGLAHFAISVESKEKVDELADLLRHDGYTINSEPRTTGDGYYESSILDPEGNCVEIIYK
ncbi:glyoxalase/bleomycin resistance/extradiol dioxygenase family protein [Bacteroidaceae bacterium HV4-6-C5C]|jgi:Lactoylglutathione lyase and related lyases|nr:glyoxalase/bleomycin resistance/extradiol dioxygenase family protein [Bacteroidaceae bacterium HV4-6-C5C]